MQPFVKYRGKLAVLYRANIDTDQIIPKQFLKSVRRTGYGQNLFFEWRYDANGRPDPAFVLNRPEYRDAGILVAGNNFGCGSSREHAVWALMQFGFRVVVAPWKEESPGKRIPGFADIFRSNSIRNGLLPIELSTDEVEWIVAQDREHGPLEATVELVSQTITVYGIPENTFHFEIALDDKQMLLEGLDPIGLTLKNLADIERFEQRHNVQMPTAESSGL
ncbi:MAG: 3-isopropylmalate dehydratase small subunit [Verrucomicrobia bacterium]|nr:MAG: 3-isopropylmalate dehydratase small subunit [Verrucomicrobiota bacterium]